MQPSRCILAFNRFYHVSRYTQPVFRSMRRPPPLHDTPKKICVLRLSALGDVTHVIPLIRRIQDQWPACEITWVCGVFEYKLLKLIEGVRFVLFDKKKGFTAYLNLRKDLRGEKFDVLLHMQVSARANLASRFIRADKRLGWDRGRSRDFHHFFINHSVAEATQQHQVDGFQSFGTALGLRETTPCWNLPITESAEKFVSRNIINNKPLFVISACSSHALRNWSAKRYAAVADYSVQAHGMLPVISGGPSAIEIETAEAIVESMNCEAINLVGKDTLEQLIGLMNKAEVVLTPDSGPSHLANAVGTAVIALHACTWSKRSGPYSSLNYCVDKFEEAAKKYKNKSASELFWGTKIEQPGVMDLITVEEVCNKLDLVMLEKNEVQPQS